MVQSSQQSQRSIRAAREEGGGRDEGHSETDRANGTQTETQLAHKKRRLPPPCIMWVGPAAKVFAYAQLTRSLRAAYAQKTPWTIFFEIEQFSSLEAFLGREGEGREGTATQTREAGQEGEGGREGNKEKGQTPPMELFQYKALFLKTCENRFKTFLQNTDGA